MDTSLDLKESVAVVTGASRGIGAAVARALGAAGAQLVLIARTTGGLEETDDAIRTAGGKPALLVPFDLATADTTTNGLDRLGEHLFEKYGRVDILAGIAGTLGALGPVAHAMPGDWSRVMTINAFANQRLIRTLDPLLRAAPAGRAVFATCNLGADTRAYWSALRASKAALEELVMAYALETAQTRLRVNLADPGPTGTKLHSAAFPGIDPKSLPSPDDSAKIFLSLLGPQVTRTGHITKQEQRIMPRVEADLQLHVTTVRRNGGGQ